jgi:NAD(P)-dependent dehydrogenase (short-subunit alcohol dehydrogenase family)
MDSYLTVKIAMAAIGARGIAQARALGFARHGVKVVAARCKQAWVDRC